MRKLIMDIKEDAQQEDEISYDFERPLSVARRQQYILIMECFNAGLGFLASREESKDLNAQRDQLYKEIRRDRAARKTRTSDALDWLGRLVNFFEERSNNSTPSVSAPL